MGRAHNPASLHRRQSPRTPRIPRRPPAPLLAGPLPARSSPPFRNVAPPRVVRSRAASRIARPHLRTHGPNCRSPATLRQRQRHNRRHLPFHRPIPHARTKSQRNGSLQNQHHGRSLRHSKSREPDARQKKSTWPSNRKSSSLHANPLRRFLQQPFHPDGNRHPRSPRPPLPNHLSPSPIRLQPRSSPNRHRRPKSHRRFLSNARRRKTRCQPPKKAPRSTLSSTVGAGVHHPPALALG